MTGVTNSNNEVGARICSKIDAVNRPYLDRVQHRFEAPRPCCSVLATPVKRIVDWLCCHVRVAEAASEGGEDATEEVDDGSSEAPSTPLASPRAASLARCVDFIYRYILCESC